MLKKYNASIFMRILLATLLPLILIFSLVIVTITNTIFKSSAGEARGKTRFFAQQSAEQVRSSFLRVAGLTELTAKDLALVAEDSESAREAARQIARHTLENAENAYRIRIYFRPGEDAFGTEKEFAYIYYSVDGKITEYPLVVDDEPDSDIAEPWYEIPLKTGTPYHDSMAHGRFGVDRGLVYVASTNYPVIHKGRVIGCVGIGMLYRKSFQFVDKWEADGSYRLLIIGEDGTILYASNEALIDKNLDSLGFEQKFFTDMKNSMYDDTVFMQENYSPLFDKESLICLYPVRLPGTTARIFMYMDTPTDLVYGEANALVRTVLLTFIIGMLLFIGGVFAVTKNIVKPIKKLTDNADRIANGQLDVVFRDFDDNYPVRHEVDRLEVSLKKMVAQLIQNHELKIVAMDAKYEKEKIAETAAAKDRFFANMSHEIRTPMNVILGMSELLLLEDLPNGQKKYIYDIRVASESLLDIINDILDLSRLESGKLPLSPVHYDFRTLMENICSLSRYLAQKKGLEFHVESIGNIPDFLYGDDARLRQVLLNLIGNAIKFTENGTITLTVIDEGQMLRFEVKDTGIGIRKEDMQYLFEPFKQVESSKNRQAKGTGLGLSISRNLLELMDGKIDIDSEFGIGSAFHVTIPKMPGDGSLVEKAREMLPTAFDPSARVLVVDDSDSNIKVAREYLRVLGITADTAACGEEAVTMLSEHDYDLVFMDHMMPEMDGVEATRQIRALSGRLKEVPIIALTANAVIGARELMLFAGMNDFLAKPIDMFSLQTILSKWMPENLIMRENDYAEGSRYSFRSAEVAGIRFRSMEMVGKRPEQAKSSGFDVSRLLKWVGGLEGVDVSLGLSRVAHNPNLYVELLTMFLNTAPTALQKIDAALITLNVSVFINEVHLLKGSLTNLGAEELSNQAATLEQIGLDGDIDLLKEKLKPFRLELEAVIGNLREILLKKENHFTLIAPPEGQRLEEGLRELREALAGFSYEKSWDIISCLLRFDWGEDNNQILVEISAYIKYFDYDAAMDRLERSFFDNNKES